MRRLALITVLCVTAPRALDAQTTSDPRVRTAIAAYDAGEFDRAIQLFDRLPASLPAPDQAVRWIYRGLIYFARGALDSAGTSFQRAVRANPAVRLDPAMHSPNRIDAFEAARADVVDEWRVAARQADARGDAVEATRNWAAVQQAMPGDAEASQRLSILRSAPPASGPPAKAVTPPQRDVEPETQTGQPAAQRDQIRQLDPGRAALLGLLVPGLGEIYTGHTGRGALIMGASAVAIGVGLLVEKVTVDCLSPPVGGICPVENIASERRERPYLAPAVGFAVVATLIGAVDAALTADRLSRESAQRETGASPGDPPRLRPPRLGASGTRLRLELFRIAF